VIDLINERRGKEYLFERGPLAGRIGVALGLVVVTTLFSANELSTFLYFRF
jgi:hypothetical protein